MKIRPTESLGRRNLVTAFAFWTIPVLLFFAQSHLAGLGRPRNRAWYVELLLQGLFWYSFAATTPAVLNLARRFPLESPRRLRAVAVHAVAGLVFVIVLAFVPTVLGRWSVPDPRVFESVAAFFASYWRNLNFLAIFGTFVYWMLTGIGHALDYAERFKEKDKRAAALELRASQLEAQLAQARLRALKMQLHPHFLFNTLHGIAALVRENDAKGAVRMIAGLSDLLRMTLDHSENETTTLGRELEFAGKYLDIERIRFQDRLTVGKDIVPETLDAEVPHLILQPLVENAVRHGISKRLAASRIEIRARREENRLVVQILDDGPGLGSEFSLDDRSGCGLGNVRARLERLYEGDSEFRLENREGGGACATVSIPFRVQGSGSGVRGLRHDEC